MVPGGPSTSRLSWPLNVDPREWPAFTRHVMEGGVLTKDQKIGRREKPSKKEAYEREASTFASWVDPPGTEGARFEAEPGRYHLFVSGVCPWASSVRAVRRVLELEDVITIDVADGQSDSNWVYLGGTTCPSFPGREGAPFFLHEVYSAAQHDATTRITVPVLWDCKLKTIVSNDSWSICKMLATSFRPLSPAKPAPRDLYPSALADEIEARHSEVYKGFLNGVYRAGITLLYGNREGHDAAAADVYTTLKAVESLLATRPFLAGDTLTLGDVRLAMTVLRFDAAYHDAFSLRDEGHVFGHAGGETSFPNVRDHARAVYALVAPTVEWPSFPQYFRWTAGHPRDAPLPDLAAIKADVERGASEGRVAALYGGAPGSAL